MIKLFKRIVGGVFFGFVGVVVLVMLIGTSSETQSTVDARRSDAPAPAQPTVSAAEQSAFDRLAFLNDVPGVAWYEVRGNNAYVGLSQPPMKADIQPGRGGDLEFNIRSWTVFAHRAYGSGFHLWVVAAEDRDKIGDLSMPFYVECTARYGKVEDYNVH